MNISEILTQPGTAKRTGWFSPQSQSPIKFPQQPEGVRRQQLLTLDQLTDINAQGDQLDVEFKSDRRNMAFYGLSKDDLAKVEGKP